MMNEVSADSDGTNTPKEEDNGGDLLGMEEMKPETVSNLDDGDNTDNNAEPEPSDLLVDNSDAAKDKLQKEEEEEEDGGGGEPLAKEEAEPAPVDLLDADVGRSMEPNEKGGDLLVNETTTTSAPVDLLDAEDDGITEPDKDLMAGNEELNKTEKADVDGDFLVGATTLNEEADDTDSDNDEDDETRNNENNGLPAEDIEGEEDKSEMKDVNLTMATTPEDNEGEEQTSRTDELLEEVPLATIGDVVVREPEKQSFSVKWAKFVLWLHRPIQAVLRVLTQVAARNPVGCILFVIGLSVLLLFGGLTTNMEMETEMTDLWSPDGSTSKTYAEWGGTAGFRNHVSGRPTSLLFHQDGDNVIFKSAVNRVFEIMDEVRGLKQYKDACIKTRKGVATDNCRWTGVTNYWNNDPETFRSQIGHQDLNIVLSNRTFPNGFDAEHTHMYGNPQYDENDRLISTTAFLVGIYTYGGNGEKLSKNMLKLVKKKSDKWALDKRFQFRAEGKGNQSLGDESLRAIWEDIHLIPIVFVSMAIFASVFFARCNAVHSRAFLGFCAVISIMLALASGYGLLMCIGVPITTLTQMIVFAVFGIGLDDTFILMGAFEQTDPDKKIHVRIEETINEMGVSVTLTTLTTTVAFALGTISKVPAVDWLCLYAFPIILFEFLYQITFFVACLVLDERRMRAGRYDCLCCKKKSNYDSNEQTPNSATNSRQLVYQRAMRKYGMFLLRPVVKIVVSCLFLGLFVACLFSAIQIRQDFSVTWLLPEDSFMIDYLDANEHYGNSGLFRSNAVFRNVDQSDPEIQQQMLQFIDDLAAMDSVGRYPERIWLKDFLEFVDEDPLREYATFESNLWEFLNVPKNVERYRGVLAGSEATGLHASRVEFSFNNVPENDVRAQMDAMREQRAVSARQPINQGKDAKDYSFFVYDPNMEFWEFNLIAVEELVLTTVVALAVMSAITMMFVPHWSAVFIVLPIVSVLYIDVIGVMNWAGISLNAVTYIVMVISIGLLVDYILHLVIRYYECEGDRKERSIRTLETLGISIVVGGTTTFLGILPLAFSTNSVFNTIFISFLSLVLLGVGHATILLPIILATIGPEDLVIVTNEDGTKSVVPVANRKSVDLADPTAVVDDKEPEEEIVPVESLNDEPEENGSFFLDE